MGVPEKDQGEDGKRERERDCFFMKFGQTKDKRIENFFFQITLNIKKFS